MTMIELNRIYNEDCLIGMKRIPDKAIDMILCDLPYGTTACKWDVIIPFEPLWEQYNRVIKNNGAIVLFGSEPFSSALRMSNIKNYRYDWIWDKKQSGNPFLAKKQPLKTFEIISVFSKKSHNYNPQMRDGKMRTKGGAKKSDLFNVNPNYKVKNDKYYPIAILTDFSNAGSRGKTVHPTQKPVTLLEYLIRTYTNEGELVLDNCMGSGSTAIACINTNRNYIGFELDKHYCDIANERIQRAMQDKATSEKGL
jgi:DNA modification methylase